MPALASVPGTPQANEAAVPASVPQKATVNRSDVTVNVTYNGAPDFRPIEKTTVKYACNSPFKVFLVAGKPATTPRPTTTPARQPPAQAGNRSASPCRAPAVR